MSSLSYSQYLNFKQNPTCVVPGQTGPQGPAGPQGPPGVSSGVIYYLQVNTGPTGPASPTGSYAMSPTLISAGPNPAYGGTYNGFFTELVGAQTNALLATFTTQVGTPGVTTIPGGAWTFNCYLYNVNQSSETTPASPQPSVYNIVNAKVTVQCIDSGVTHTLGMKTFQSISSANGGPILFQVGVSPTSISNPTQAYLQVIVTLISAPAGTVTQFWTQGDYLSDVISSIPSGQGPTGPSGTNGLSGATGPQGPQGPAGTNGTNGTNGVTGPTGPTGYGPQLITYPAETLSQGDNRNVGFPDSTGIYDIKSSYYNLGGTSTTVNVSLLSNYTSKYTIVNLSESGKPHDDVFNLYVEFICDSAVQGPFTYTLGSNSFVTAYLLNTYPGRPEDRVMIVVGQVL
uniref:Collagen-like protein n=1 Tax=viral metagenome TaxID=1070528 RepID=A0A6C0JWB8_9ZZZZ